MFDEMVWGLRVVLLVDEDLGVVCPQLAYLSVVPKNRRTLGDDACIQARAIINLLNRGQPDFYMLGNHFTHANLQQIILNK